MQSTFAAAVQEQVANLKIEAAQAAEQLRQAKSKTDNAEKGLNATRQSAYEDSQAAIKDKQQAHTTITNLQVCASLSDERQCPPSIHALVQILFWLVHVPSQAKLTSTCMRAAFASQRATLVTDRVMHAMRKAHDGPDA